MIEKNRIIAILSGLIILISGCSMGEPPLVLSIAPVEVEIYQGTSLSLSAMLSAGQTTDDVIWKSSDSSIVLVDQHGSITGLNPGQAKVTAHLKTDKSVSGSCLVTVLDVTNPVEKINVLLSHRSVNIRIEEEVSLAAFILPADAPQSVIWESEDTSIATVSDTGVVTGQSIGATIIIARSRVFSSRYAYCLVKVDSSSSTVTIDIKPSLATIKVDETIQLSSVVNNETDQSVIWKSDDTSVATVTAGGVVQAVNEGSTLISAVSAVHNTVMGIAEITVIPADPVPGPISITPSIIEIKVGEVFQVDVAVRPGIENLIWESDDTIVAAVDQIGNITGIAPGTTIIHAINEENTEEKASCIVNVVKDVISVDVSVAPASVTLDINQRYQLEASIFPDSVNQSVTWESYDVRVAIVDSLGVVTARDAGIVMIVARSQFDRSKTGFCVVTVTENVVGVESIQVTPDEIELNKDEEIQLSARALPAGCDQRINWTSANTDIAEVDQWGSVTGKAEGVVFIVAASVENPSISNACIVRVVEPYKNLVVSIDENHLSLAPGEAATLEAVVTPEEIDDKSLTWKSSEPDVVSVDQNGRILALGVGSSVITAVSNANPLKSDICRVNVNHRELIEGIGFEADCKEGDELWFTFTAAAGGEYEIFWDESGTGSYTGEIAVAGYKSDKVTPLFAEIDAGPVTIQSDRNQRIYIKAREKNSSGSFRIGYSLSDVVIPETWTLMVYINTNQLEESMINNVKEMMEGYHESIGINVVLLLDKYSSKGYSLPGLDNTETGLFTITEEGLNPVYNGKRYFNIREYEVFELNMGDAEVLGKFIDYGKANYPASHYGLIIMSHGHAAGGLSGDDLIDSDRLHLGEISAELTAAHSVNLLGFNSCLMGNAETAYQFRKDPDNQGFSSEIMLAPPSLTHGAGWNYLDAFRRISLTEGGTSNGEPETVSGNMELIYSPSSMTAEDLGLLFLEEHRDGMYNDYNQFFYYDSLNCYDLTKITAVKENLDLMSASLYEHDEKDALEAIRDDSSITARYFRTVFEYQELKDKELTYFPYYDLKSFCEGINLDHFNFSAETRALAQAIIAAVEETIVYSYYGDYVSYDNKYGLSIFFSNGDSFYNDQEMYRYQWWYNANNVLSNYSEEKYFGEIAWCIDKASDTLNEVDNWFELLDAWYDPDGNGEAGGCNGYQY